MPTVHEILNDVMRDLSSQLESWAAEAGDWSDARAEFKPRSSGVWVRRARRVNGTESYDRFHAEPGSQLADAVDALQRLTQRPEGAWLTATLTCVAQSGQAPSRQVHFSLDEEPGLYDDADTRYSVEDVREHLSRFPRDDADVPAWMRRRLAGHPVEPYEDTIPKAGASLASRSVLDGSGRIKWMVRGESQHPSDNGWRIFSDIDTDESLNATGALQIVDFNQLIALEPILQEIWNLPVGSDLQVVKDREGTWIVDTASAARLATVKRY